MYREPIFELFGREVYLYGVFIAVGILACMLVFYLYTSKRKLPSTLQDFVFFVAIFAIAIGFLFAMLFQSFYDWLENPTQEFRITSSITVMGGLIGGALSFLIIYFCFGKYVFRRGKDKDAHLKYFSDIFDVAPLCIVIAHAFGRIGCLMGGCCHGKFLSNDPVFGGLYMTTSIGTGYFVPTQLYEAIFLFVLFAVLSVLYFKGCKITMHIYLIAYGVWRIIIEFFRVDERGFVFLGLAPSQWQSIVFIAIGVVLFVVYTYKKWPFFKQKEKQEKIEE